MITGYVRPFDQRDPRYRSCCGIVPAIYGAYIICALDILAGIGLLVGVIFGRTGLTNGDHTAYLSAAVVACIVVLVAVILTIVGLIKGKAGYIIMHLIVRIVGVLAFIIAAVMFGVALVVVDSDPNPYIPYWKRGPERETMRQVIRSAFVAQCAAYSVFVLVQFWFFTILLAAYRYIRDKRPVVVTEYSTYS